MTEKLWVECSCHTHEHIVLLSKEDEHPDGEVTVSFQIPKQGRFLKRLATGFLYIMGRYPRWGHWCTTIIEYKDIAPMVGFLQSVKVPTETPYDFGREPEGGNWFTRFLHNRFGMDFESISYSNASANLPSQFVRWEGGVCPNCGDWMFYDGKVLSCDCGEKMQLIPAPGDNCQVCKGARDGVRGNEQWVDGVCMCDDCHADSDQPGSASWDAILEKKYGSELQREDPMMVERKSTEVDMIPLSQYLEFVSKFDSGAYPHLRFGQAFINTYILNSDPTLFYMIDRKTAEKYICNKYLVL